MAARHGITDEVERGEAYAVALTTAECWVLSIVADCWRSMVVWLAKMVDRVSSKRRLRQARANPQHPTPCAFEDAVHSPRRVTTSVHTRRSDGAAGQNAEADLAAGLALRTPPQSC
jgi:hypothetical protein